MNVPAPDLLRKYSAPGPRYTSYPTVPSWTSTPTEAQWLAHLDTALGALPAAGASLYVHIPFCHALCTFCGCNMRVTRNHALVGPYVQTVLREQRTLMSRLGRSTIEIGEIYLGGGTPTYLHAEELDVLLSGLLANTTVRPDASLAVEADPRTVHAAQLEVLRRHGFNRLSIGVQDFDPRVQDIVNRQQAEDVVRKTTEDARALGFRSINYDLIYGLPLQTSDSIAATMDAMERLRPDRIAFYPYAHVPWIRSSQRRFTEADLPDAEARRSLYLLGRERLEALGYIEIGMDHFALPTDDLVLAAEEGRLHRNFMGYSPRFTRPLIGLGVSSIGDAGGAYAQNEKNLVQYGERVARDELPIQRGHLLDDEDVVLRRHILRLTTRYETDWRDDADVTAFLPEAVARLAEPAADGLVVLGDRSVRVTETGRSFLRDLCLAFDARLARRVVIEPPLTA